jgi:dTDP-glucose 4,6-dehydratase
LKTLVTGGVGFIGSNFVHYLANETSDEIYVLDSLAQSQSLDPISSISGDRVKFVQGSVTDGSVLGEIVDEVDRVVHFAAETHNDKSLTGPRAFVESNVFGTFEVLEAVRLSGKRLHHISTDEVFGDLPLDSKAKFTEETPYRPSSPYSATKAASDHLVRSWVRSFGIDATISNCSNNFGPWQHVEKFIPRQITELALGRKPRIYGDGANVRDWIHVDDHSDAIFRILESGLSGETYLVGADGERTNLQVVMELLRIFDMPGDFLEFIRDRPGHDLRYSIDATKLRREFGWRPRNVSFEESLQSTVDWYLDNKAWWEPLKAETEAKYLELESAN